MFRLLLLYRLNPFVYDFMHLRDERLMKFLYGILKTHTHTHHRPPN